MIGHDLKAWFTQEQVFDQFNLGFSLDEFFLHKLLAGGMFTVFSLKLLIKLLQVSSTFLLHRQRLVALQGKFCLLISGSGEAVFFFDEFIALSLRFCFSLSFGIALGLSLYFGLSFCITLGQCLGFGLRFCIALGQCLGFCLGLGGELSG
ncbi:MAG: hypothetical protein Q8K22_05090 [Rhodoferax sp.]|nr:hypothetical protein [Rhodoferax sp.]